MRHHNNKRKFGRDKTGKRALMNSLALNLIVREKIKTTEPKAKELRPFIEKLITHAKADNMAARRLIVSRLSGRVQIFQIQACEIQLISAGRRIASR